MPARKYDSQDSGGCLMAYRRRRRRGRRRRMRRVFARRAGIRM